MRILCTRTLLVLGAATQITALAALPAVAAAAPPAAATSPQAEATLQVRVQLDHLSSGGAQRRPVRPGEVLHTGDVIALRVAVSHDAYVYVVQVFPGGGALRLFPPAGREPDVLLPAHVETSLPAQGGITLDDELGEENIVVVATRRPLAEAAPALGQRLRVDAPAAERRLAEFPRLAADEPPRPPPEAPRPPPPPLRPGERDPLPARAALPVVLRARAGRDGIVAARLPFRHAASEPARRGAQPAP